MSDGDFVGWIVTDPEGRTYNVDRITYEADDAGQIGNPFVRRTTPVLRCIPADRCLVCHGGGHVNDLERYKPGSGFMPDKLCESCGGDGLSTAVTTT